MAGEKTTRKCYGPKGLVERLKECPWIKWSPLETSLEGFEFDGNRLRDEAVTARVKCQLKVTDTRIGEEFIVEGFCCQGLLDTFFLLERNWKPLQIAGCYVSPDLTGRNLNPYEVSLEVLTSSPRVD